MRTLSDLPEDRQTYLLALARKGLMIGELAVYLPHRWVETEVVEAGASAGAKRTHLTLTKSGLARLNDLRKAGFNKEIDQARLDAIDIREQFSPYVPNRASIGAARAATL